MIDVRAGADSAILALDDWNSSLSVFDSTGTFREVREFGSSRARDRLLGGERLIDGALTRDGALLLTLADGEEIGKPTSGHIIYLKREPRNEPPTPIVALALRTTRKRASDLQPPVPQFMPTPLVSVVDATARTSATVWIVSDQEAGRIEVYDLDGKPRILVQVRSRLRAPTEQEREALFLRGLRTHYSGYDSLARVTKCSPKSSDIFCMTVEFYRHAKDLGFPTVPFATAVTRAGTGVWIRAHPNVSGDSVAWTFFDATGHAKQRLTLAASDRIDAADRERILVARENHEDRRLPREIGWYRLGR